MTEYKNSNGSLSISCGSNGALVHCNNNSRQKANPCSGLVCTKEVEHGEHVIKYPRNALKNNISFHFVGNTITLHSQIVFT